MLLFSSLLCKTIGHLGIVVLLEIFRKRLVLDANLKKLGKLVPDNALWCTILPELRVLRIVGEQPLQAGGKLIRGLEKTVLSRSIKSAHTFDVCDHKGCGWFNRLWSILQLFGVFFYGWNRFRRRDKYLLILSRYMNNIRVLSVQHTLLGATKEEQTTDGIWPVFRAMEDISCR